MSKQQTIVEAVEEELERLAALRPKRITTAAAFNHAGRAARRAPEPVGLLGRT